MAQETFEKVRSHADQVRRVSEFLDPKTASCSERRMRFDRLCHQFQREEDPVSQHFAKLMKSFPQFRLQKEIRQPDWERFALWESSGELAIGCKCIVFKDLPKPRLVIGSQ